MRSYGKSSDSIVLWAFVVVASLVGGVGFVYAPIVVLGVVAVIFSLGLWLALRGNRSATRPSPLGLDGDALKSIGSHPLVGRLVTAYLLVFWVIMVIPMLNVAPREVGEQTAQAAASGSPLNQILVGSFGVIGAFFLVGVVTKFGSTYRWALGLWALYLGWGYVTLFWTAYTPLSLRGLVAFALVSLGSLGFGAGFYGSRPDGTSLFLKHIFAAGVISALFIVVPLPLHLGQYNPLDPSTRMTIAGDFTRYVSRPVLCSILVLAMSTVLGLRRWRWHDFLWVLLLLAPIFVLKTRGPVLWCMLAFAVVYLVYRTRAHERALQVGMLLIVAFATYLSYTQGVVERVVPFLARGSIEETLTLTGRTDLWPILIQEFLERPWIGVGFAAFWNPSNLFMMEGAVGFPVVSAHNGFLEELLATGVVGLVLFMTFWFYLMTLALRKGLRGEPVGWMALLFMVAYLTLNLTTSLMQSYMEITFIITFVFLGLMASRDAAAKARAKSGSEASPPVAAERQVVG